MDELRQFCVRMLDDGEAARTAEQAARAAAGSEDRIALLRAAVSECRARPGEAGAGPEAPVGDPRERSAEPEAPAGDPDQLAAAVGRELASATAGLPGAQRELLALRELLGLTYDELAAVTGADQDTIAPALAHARVALRGRLRDTAQPEPDCPDHERALGTIALRQDHQPVQDGDGEWLIDHLGACPGCARAHAAMLEAVACYRAWRPAPEGAAA